MIRSTTTTPAGQRGRGFALALVSAMAVAGLAWGSGAAVATEEPYDPWTSGVQNGPEWNSGNGNGPEWNSGNY